MFRKHKARSSNLLFGIFRLLLSLIILATLLVGLLSAYKHFSGVDPLKLSPKSFSNTFMGILSEVKLFQDLQEQVGQKFPTQNIITDKIGIDSKDAPDSQPKVGKPKLILKFALLADSHNDNIFLKKALDQIGNNHSDVKFIIGLGDYSDVGTYDELKNAKKELDSHKIRYFAATGDHDLWDARDKSLSASANFESVFGPTYQYFIQDNFKFIILFNSDNYLGLGETQKNWLTNLLTLGSEVRGTFVFLHEPLIHPSSDHFMGRVEEKLKLEAEELIDQFSKAGIKKVFAGDTHFFSEYSEPRTGLPMVTIGAITSTRNLQLPRFAIVSVFEDGSSTVEDIAIK